MTPLVSGLEIVVAVRVTVPPGVTADQARAMMANNGISMPVGLLQFTRQVFVEVVAVGQSVTIPPLEDGGVLKLQ